MHLQLVVPTLLESWGQLLAVQAAQEVHRLWNVSNCGTSHLPAVPVCSRMQSFLWIQNTCKRWDENGCVLPVLGVKSAGATTAAATWLKKTQIHNGKKFPQIIKEGDANSTASVFPGLCDFLSYVVWLSNTKWCTTATKIHKLQQLNEEWKHENYKHLKKLKLQLWNHPQYPFLYCRVDPKKRELLLSSCFLLEQDERKKKAADTSQQRSSPPTASWECQQQGYSSCSGSVVGVVAQKSLILNPKR